MNGYLIGNGAIMVSADGSGKPIVETPAPEVMEGYVAKPSWRDNGSSIVQTWEIAPVEGTAQEAALALSRMQYMTLPDDVAYALRPLAGEWIAGETYYGPDDPSGMPQSRKTHMGDLYKCLQTHVSQAGWEPSVAPSLWAKVLPGQEGNEPEEGYAEWEQPGAMNGYAEGDKVLHNDHLWESTQDDNVWEPGAVGAPWTDLGVYPPEE